MNNQSKALMVAIICVIAFIGVGIFLGVNFKNINQDGVACISEPLLYAEERMLETTNDEYTCKCEIKSRTPDLPEFYK